MCVCVCVRCMLGVCGGGVGVRVCVVVYGECGLGCGGVSL